MSSLTFCNRTPAEALRSHVKGGDILLLSVLVGPDIRAQQFHVKTHTLKNGLKILVHEDHSIPNVVLYIFYRVGSRNERPGTTGLSHYFEHMMFNGAKKYGPGEFDRVMEANGGSNNAYTTQTFFRIGNVGVARSNPDRVWVNVVNTVFGGRFTSWLSTELRIKSGLTYGASSRFDERLKPGPFFINSFTPNATTAQALDLTLATLRRLHEVGITEEELQSAKTYIKGQFPPQVETTDRLAATLAELEFFGLDERDINTLYAKVDAMMLADANRIVQEYFPLENLVFVLIGRASEIEPVAKKYAKTIDRKGITEPGF